MNSQDINRTMEFILRSQARAEARQDTFDRRLDAIRKIIQQGMRMLAKTEASLAKTEASLSQINAREDRTEAIVAELVAGQKRTDAALVVLVAGQTRTDTALAELAQTLKAFVDSMLKSNNGHAQA